jgi:signal transduction histidine kinase
LQAAVAIQNARQYELVERLAQAERWAEIGQLTGSLAHRIGNKGGIIRLSANELEEHLREEFLIDDEFVTEIIDTIRRNNQYILDLSDLLFKPVRSGEEKLTSINIELMLDSALASAEIPPDVEVVKNYMPDPPLVKANQFEESGTSSCRPGSHEGVRTPRQLK